MGVCQSFPRSCLGGKGGKENGGLGSVRKKSFGLESTTEEKVTTREGFWQTEPLGVTLKRGNDGRNRSCEEGKKTKKSSGVYNLKRTSGMGIRQEDPIQ